MKVSVLAGVATVGVFAYFFEEKLFGKKHSSLTSYQNSVKYVSNPASSRVGYELSSTEGGFFANQTAGNHLWTPENVNNPLFDEKIIAGKPVVVPDTRSGLSKDPREKYMMVGQFPKQMDQNRYAQTKPDDFKIAVHDPRLNADEINKTYAHPK